jgi:hypothetical protein
MTVTASSTSSGSDAEDHMLPLTPDSKRSYRRARCAPISHRGSPTSRHSKMKPNRGVHPYCRPPSCFEEEHLGHKLSGRPVNDDESSEPMTPTVGPAIGYSSSNI